MVAGRGAHLMVLRGPDLGTLHRLEDGDDVVVGGDPFRAGVLLRDGSVGPEEARIFAGPKGHYFVEPLGTAGRAELNGEALVGARPLRDGDRLAVGESVIEYSEPDPLKAQLNERLYRTLSEDHLTGLLAKPRFDEEFEGVLASARAREEPLGVIMADVDNLKEINDEHGHLVGEFAVGEIGRIIGAYQHRSRRATRFGGDEYQAVLPGEEPAAVVGVAEGIRRSVENHPFERQGVTVEPTLSLGVASYPRSGATTDDLTRAADRALYRAKHAGGNTVSE